MSQETTAQPCAHPGPQTFTSHMTPETVTPTLKLNVPDEPIVIGWCAQCGALEKSNGAFIEPYATRNAIFSQQLEEARHDLGDFAWALSILKQGGFVTREGWNGKGMSVRLHKPPAENLLPYLYLSTADGNLVPWIPSQTDLLSLDWYGSSL